MLTHPFITLNKPFKRLDFNVLHYKIDENIGTFKITSTSKRTGRITCDEAYRLLGVASDIY